MQYDKAKYKIIEILKEGLDEKLTYHGLRHTLDVHSATKELCQLENVDEYHTLLLKTAALLHDSGFVKGRQEHEKLGCEIAKEILPSYDYTEGEIEKICGMIMATKVPQTPHNIYEEILCDADLDYLGREDFYDIGESLFNELSNYGVLDSWMEWNALQIKFLRAHQYFTKTNKKRRQPRKQEFINEIVDGIA